MSVDGVHAGLRHSNLIGMAFRYSPFATGTGGAPESGLKPWGLDLGVGFNLYQRPSALVL